MIVDQALAVAGRGLEGDSYFDGRGTFSNKHARGHDLTLVEAEVLDELHVTAEAARRNVVTRGIDLNALVGNRFRSARSSVSASASANPARTSSGSPTPVFFRRLVHQGGLGGCAQRRHGSRR